MKRERIFILTRLFRRAVYCGAMAKHGPAADPYRRLDCNHREGRGRRAATSVRATALPEARERKGRSPRTPD